MPSITLSYKQTSEKCLSGLSNKVVTDNLGKNQFRNWNAFIDGEEKKLKEVIRCDFFQNTILWRKAGREGQVERFLKMEVSYIW